MVYFSGMFRKIFSEDERMLNGYLVLKKFLKLQVLE